MVLIWVFLISYQYRRAGRPTIALAQTVDDTDHRSEKSSDWIIVIATSLEPLPGQVAMALSTVGFQIVVICPAKNPVHRIRKMRPRFVYAFLGISMHSSDRAVMKRIEPRSGTAFTLTKGKY
jgi:hypothetical protein